MPSHTRYSALLSLGPLAWEWHTFQARTRLRFAPWRSSPVERDESDEDVENDGEGDPEETRTTIKFQDSPWSASEEARMNEFYNVFSTLSDSDQLKALGPNTSYPAEKELWVKFVNTGWTQWGMSKVTFDTMLAENCGAGQQARRKGGNKAGRERLEYEWTDYRHVPTDSWKRNLAVSLFGNDAMDGRRLKENVNRFITRLTVIAYQSSVKTSQRNASKIGDLQSKIEEIYNEWIDQKKSISLSDFNAWLKLYRSLIGMLRGFNNEEARQELETKRGLIHEMILALGGQERADGRIFRIPKALSLALQSLVSPQAINLARIALEEALLEAQDGDIVLPYETYTEEEKSSWSEGTEAYRAFTMTALWAALGLEKEQRIPFVHRRLDPKGQRDPRTDPGFRDSASPDEIRGLVPLNVMWHQLVGVVCIVDNSFEGKPILLMDEVGLGKTLQTAGAIGCLVWFREYYEEKGCYPGKYSKYKELRIPDSPSLYVVPSSLVYQTVSELGRYLRVDGFAILPYFDLGGRRDDFWKRSWEHTRLLPYRPSRRIIVSNCKYVEYDVVNRFPKLKRPFDPLVSSTATSLENTLFGRDYLVTVVDEIANCRNSTHKLFLGVRYLEPRSFMMIGVSATPLMTKVLNLFNIGCVLGIEGILLNAENIMAHIRAVSRAVSAERKQRKLIGATPSIDLASDDTDTEDSSGIEGHGKTTTRSAGHSGTDQLTGNGLELMRIAANTQEMTVSRSLNLKAIQYIKKFFDGHTIHRTIQSLDWNKNPISSLPPLIEVHLLLNMYAPEAEVYHEAVRQLIQEDRDTDGQASVSGGAEFFTGLRQITGHYRSSDVMVLYGSREEWESQKSRKIEALIQVATHHLSENGAKVLRSDSSSDFRLIPDPSHSHHFLLANKPDKILIYSAFPSINKIIGGILTLYGISSVDICGRDSAMARDKKLKEFRESTFAHGPRVLIVSGVGNVGLNVQEANITILLECNWSAAEDTQLKGRTYRHGQEKHVIIYRLVLQDTIDVWRNNISFEKEVLQKSFASSNKDLADMIAGCNLGYAFDKELDDTTSTVCKDAGKKSRPNRRKGAKSRTKPKESASQSKTKNSPLITQSRDTSSALLDAMGSTQERAPVEQNSGCIPPSKRRLSAPESILPKAKRCSRSTTNEAD